MPDIEKVKGLGSFFLKKFNTDNDKLSILDPDPEKICLEIEDNLLREITCIVAYTSEQVDISIYIMMRQSYLTQDIM